MARRLLQKGDIIRLEKGMSVYANVPDNMLFSSRPFSTTETKSLVEIGRVYRKMETSKPKIIAEIVAAINKVVEVSEQQVEDFVNSLNFDYSAKEFDTSIYEGEYVVDYVDSNGGGKAISLFSVIEYPDGWHVYCYKKDNPSIKVDFYQTGFFTAMIPDIEPINS